QVLEPHAAAHELAGHRDHQAEVVDDELLLRALVSLARLARDHELGLPIERRVRADQLDQRRQIVEFTAVAHRHPSFGPPTKTTSFPSLRSDLPTAQPFTHS